ncbi:hypothetical protein ACFFH4_26465 [Halalkalibacter alkalisediminis]|uniref:Uncharacterized protein n=1 Tax=Halalkalibacter alkalisediminis TaxID=935616 RepID=A0ABV6NNM2_9BACI|nr:hypothetical protein [Halalkalibacter alkalisediminis]
MVGWQYVYATTLSLMSSEKKSNRYQGANEKIDKRTVGYQRRKEAVKKSTEPCFTY